MARHSIGIDPQIDQHIPRDLGLARLFGELRLNRKISTGAETPPPIRLGPPPVFPPDPGPSPDPFPEPNPVPDPLPIDIPTSGELATPICGMLLAIFTSF